MDLFDFDACKAISGEITDILYEDEKIRIERIVSMGQITPHNFVYDQAENEFVTVVHGEAELLFPDKGETLRLKEGGNIMIKAGVRHRVSYTSSPCVWLCVFEK